MVRLAHERVLLIGDSQRQVQGALLQAVPGAQVTSVSSIFDGIAELAANPYTTVLAAAEPMERRPEAAVRALRELSGDGRLILFGHPTLELLSRKMMQFGCDDYIVTPANPGELQQMLGTPPLRLASTGGEATEQEGSPQNGESAVAGPVDATSTLAHLPLADVLLESLLQHPNDSATAAVQRLNTELAGDMRFSYRPAGAAPATAIVGHNLLDHPVRAHGEDMGTLYLSLPQDADEIAGRHVLAQLAHLVSKLAALQDRHNRLQKLAVTDELTGLYNARYFRTFLTQILEKARAKHFPVTLLLFDIDDFKKYNDQFGHGVGDDILRQTAALMKRCTREHDRVCRIGGDEFAVVFWDKEGPRQPHSGKPGVRHGPPQTPLDVFKRFKALIASEDFPVLGPSGKGVLGISGGLAVYPYDARDAASLIEEADRRLMLGAKKSGKNSIFIVGTEDAPQSDTEDR